jgi:hypothetical protein
MDWLRIDKKRFPNPDNRNTNRGAFIAPHLDSRINCTTANFYAKTPWVNAREVHMTPVAPLKGNHRFDKTVYREISCAELK